MAEQLKFTDWLKLRFPRGCPIDFDMKDLEMAFRAGEQIGTAKTQEPPASEWKPIETAPKNRTTVLLSMPTKFKKWNAHLPLAGCWFDSYWGIFNADEAVQKVCPTHWMPLPPAP